ncbi:MAG: hypothetical protein GTN74_14290 [Proteobacteria bacterium]|nr:hypothetical protein [Pseudomonadota bacterium]NIS71700.1 hypothetical protein [Pseudomonadota bacterium]
MHIDEKKRFDKRTIDRRIRNGLISRKEFETYLKKLPNVAHKIDDEKEAGEKERGRKVKDKKGP